MDLPLAGLVILVVDDEFLTSLEVKAVLEAIGASVLGPAGRLDQACALVAENALDGAVIDVKLDGVTSQPLAADLRRRGIPFIVATGYEREMLPVEYDGAPQLIKPFTAQALKTHAVKTFPRAP